MITEQLHDGLPAEVILPEGYHFAGPDWIPARERVELMRSAGWNVSSTELTSGDYHYRSAGIAMLDVGVRVIEDDELVGFGRMLSRGSNGELCDFVVSPKHRHQGIGRAIIDERLRRAEAAGVVSFFIPELTSTNSLRSYYEEHGFREALTGELVRGRDPIRIPR